MDYNQLFIITSIVLVIAYNIGYFIYMYYKFKETETIDVILYFIGGNTIMITFGPILLYVSLMLFTIIGIPYIIIEWIKYKK